MDHQMCSLFRQGAADRATQAPGAAGDQRAFTFQVEFVFHIDNWILSPFPPVVNSPLCAWQMTAEAAKSTKV